MILPGRPGVAMPYEQLPDPRPTGVRLTLGRMSRRAAWIVCGSLAGVAVAAFAVAWFDRERVAVWGLAGLASVLAAGRYVTAIRWADQNGTWPHRRGRHRHRTKSPTNGA
jgi:hypothetical protein